MKQKRPYVRRIVGPDGQSLSVADLPPVNTVRWVMRRKATVVCAVKGGLLTLEEACKRYRLSNEEFLAWENAYNQNGLLALRVTHLQDYRPTKKAA